MGRKIQFAPDEYYHIYNRGTEKRELFLDGADYRRFMTNLFMCNGTECVHHQFRKREADNLYLCKRGEPLVAVGAFCLMPNHFHILVKEIAEGGISKFMQKLATGYTMYFNKRYERTGALFQGKFKTQHASDDRYLKYLFSYIHLNPVKLVEARWREQGVKDAQKIQSFLKNYYYSSYQDYLGLQRAEKSILSPKAFPEYFENLQDFSQQMTDWLKFEELVKVRP